MTPHTIRLFENIHHAQIYAKYRPSYPKELSDKIIAFVGKHKVERQVLVDLACGSGQSTFHFADHFNRTIGVDISKAQIDCALQVASARKSNVEFSVAPANRLPFEDQSVDVITCAQAWHWIESKTAFPEIIRVLKKPGVLAVYGYSRGIICHEQCDKLLLDYYSDTLTWHANRALINNLYRDVSLPYPLSERHDIKEKLAYSIDEFKGYLTTWSAYQDYCKKHPGNTILEDLLDQITNILSVEQGVSDAPLTVHMDTPYFLLLSTNA